MRRLFTAVLLTAACASLTAQSTQPPASPSSQEAAIQKTPVLTVSGCLRNGEDPSTFVLSNVKWLDKSDKAATEKPPSVGTSGTDADSSGETLRLVGAPSGVRMSEHVGHTVEITGTLIDEVAPKPEAKADEVSPKPQAKAEAAAPVEQSAQPPARHPAPKSGHTMNVRTIKLIGESCSGR